MQRTINRKVLEVYLFFKVHYNHPVMLAICIFVLLLALTHLRLIDPKFGGFYPFGYERAVLIPVSYVDALLTLFFVGLGFSVIIIFLDNAIFRRFFEWKISNYLLALFSVVLFIFLYLYNLDGSHVALMDSYEILAGAVEIINGEPYTFMHKAAYGASLALIPAMLIGYDEFIAQIFIVIYSALAFLMGLYLWRKTNLGLEHENEFLWFYLFLMMINPMFVAISRTISYEPILLFELSILLIIMLKILDSSKFGFSSIKYYVLLSIVLIFLISMRVNYIIVIGGPIALTILIYLIEVAIREKRNPKLFFVHLLVAGIIAIIIFLYSRTLLPPWLGRHSGGGSTLSRIFNPKHFLAILPVSLYIITSFLNSPPSRRMFAFAVVILGKYSILNIILGLVALSIAYKGWRELYVRSNTHYFAVFLAQLVVFNVLFYSTYGGFQARYLVISIYILIFLFAKGIVVVSNRPSTRVIQKDIILLPKRKLRILLKIKKIVKFSIILLLMFAVYNASITSVYWRTSIVKSDNTASTSQHDLTYLFEIIDGYGTNPKIVFTTLEALTEFYKYKLKLDIEIFYVYKYFIVNGLTPETFYGLVKIIKKYLSMGYIVFYLAGWPELDGYSFLTPNANYKDYYKLMKELFSYKLLRTGPVGARTSRYLIGPEYELIVIKNYVGLRYSSEYRFSSLLYLRG